MLFNLGWEIWYGGKKLTDKTYLKLKSWKRLRSIGFIVNQKGLEHYRFSYYYQQLS